MKVITVLLFGALAVLVGCGNKEGALGDVELSSAHSLSESTLSASSNSSAIDSRCAEFQLEAPRGVVADTGDEKITLYYLSSAGQFRNEGTIGLQIFVAHHPLLLDEQDSIGGGLGVRAYEITEPNQIFVVDGLDNGREYFVVLRDFYDECYSDFSEQVTAIPSKVGTLDDELVLELNDTGVNWCTDLSMIFLDCDFYGLDGEDGKVGRDAEIFKEEKTGFGKGGFDFSKIDKSGQVLEHDAEEWECVQDNVTGLLWEVKTVGGDRNATDQYAWYEPAPKVNAADPGREDGGSCALSNCNTHSYSNYINQIELCGYNDWRLPTRRELLSIADFGEFRPAIDLRLFPNTQFNHAFYWTSTNNHFSAWAIHFTTGGLRLESKWDRVGRVRLVRGGE